MNYKFPIIYWSNHSTKVQFKPFDMLPTNASVSSCMVFAKRDDAVLLAKPPRGWGLPGGHKEAEETPEECAVREVLEETGVLVGNLKLVGGWKAQKLVRTEANSKYPDVSYQLLFLADVVKVNELTPEFESLDRKFVKFESVKQYHHEYERFSPILTYILDLIRHTDD